MEMDGETGPEIDETISRARAAAAGPSKRAMRRAAEAAGRIADRVVSELRPDASLIEIGRVVTARCTRAGLPTPSRKSLRARVAHLRRHGARGLVFHERQITIDHCAIEVGEPSGEAAYAVLSLAALEPPGLLLAWSIGVTPPDTASVARLVAEAQRRASGWAHTRLHYASGDGELDRDLLGAIAASGVDRTGLVSRAPSFGIQSRRLLGRRLGRRLLKPRLTAAVGSTASAVDEETLERLVAETAPFLDRLGTPVGRSVPPFNLLRPKQADQLLRALERIAAATA